MVIGGMRTFAAWSLTQRLLAILLLAGFAVLTVRFAVVIDHGDNLWLERLFLCALVVLHAVAWAWPFRPQLSKIRLGFLLAALIAVAIGLAWGKTAILAVGYTGMVVSACALANAKTKVRPLWIMSLVVVPLVAPLPMQASPNLLQKAAILVAGGWISALYDYATVQGTTIILNGYSMVIASACDGTALLRLGLATALYCSIYSSSWLAVALRLVLAMILALSCNWLRLLMLAVLAHHGEAEFAFAHGHALIGHLTSAATLMPIFYFSPMQEHWHRQLVTIKALAAARCRSHLAAVPPSP